MKTRLISCDRLHPGKESDIRWYVRKHRGVGRFKQCVECNRTAARLRYHGKPVPKPVEQIQTPSLEPYNVLPRLTWVPPSL